MFSKAVDIVMKYFLEGGELVLKGINTLSFDTCLLIGLVALVLSIFGWDKGKKISLISPAVYIILQIFLEVWFGVWLKVNLWS